MRIVIAGGPRTGKTTLAIRLGVQHFIIPRHTDDLIATHAWSEASDEAARWLEHDGPFIIEGVAAVRALRKFLKAHPSRRPCDVVHWLFAPKVEQTPGQRAMAKAALTIWIQIRGELEARDVCIDEG